MSFFDKLKKVLNLNKEEKSVSDNYKKDGKVEVATKKTILDSPNYDWFLTEESQKEYEKYTSIKAYSEYEKERENGNKVSDPLTIEVRYLNKYLNKEKEYIMPNIYFYSFVKSLNTNVKMIYFQDLQDQNILFQIL